MNKSEVDTFTRMLKKKSSMKSQIENIFQINHQQPNY